jgi:hypothetical protein
MHNPLDNFTKALQLMERESTYAFEIGKCSKSLKVKLVNRNTVKFLSTKCRVEMNLLEEKTMVSLPTFILQLYERCVDYLELWGCTSVGTPAFECIYYYTFRLTLLNVQMNLFPRDLIGPEAYQ